MPEKIVVGFDGSDGSRRALFRAIRLAAQEHSLLEVVSVEEIPRYAGTVGEVIEEHEAASHQFKKLHAEAEQIAIEQGVIVKSILLAGHPAKTLVDYVGEAKTTLLVIGHSGHSELWGTFLGTTADKIVRHAPCSVLVVR